MQLVSPQAWYVIRTHPRQEFRAEQNLEAGGIEVFLPRIAARSSRGSQRHTEIAPLFPQYLFARFDPEMRLHDVAFTRGVQAPLRVGSNLAVLGDEAVEFVRSRVQADGLIHLGEQLHPGDRVIVEDGPFQAFVGVIERVLPQRERVLVLLTSVKVPLRLDLSAGAVRRVPCSAA